MKRSDRYKTYNKPNDSNDLNQLHHNTYFKPVNKPQKKKKGKGIILKLLIPILIIIGIIIGVMYALSLRADTDELKNITEKESFVYASDMRDYTKGAFIAMEDERFYKHHGFDVKGTSRALFSTLSDKSVQGGSTITQQVVKNYYYDNEQSVTRKIKELFVAHRVEKEYDKNEILSFYMNNIYYGSDQYTIESAANHYFGVTTDKNNPNLPQISVLQSAILASKINAPSVYNINDMSDNFTNRVKTDLEKMKQQGYISNSQYENAIQELGV
ncbi:monofunctional peptidoglycan glycosyltransferase SgtB [Staphylococcus saprophyticus]|uniref:monofunctional peptidoglycan glycosyltransferase SgtB n=1 Tax=Staphylococcus saprophyticus TaxID=29385 RepID=UPI000859E693|nr:monofunctional peptidoglycan glycosyltransferase SgtB [Staphylococcus saprophyticus]MBN6851416.1 monofunctional peptidoglycan glycosyltransferase SgtB [Staphylococcus saprophyticus]MDW3888186.1 monofunctional peptidoglycan glycosyltransferase SgtB [Staphylococcus saprophyticus]MDW3893122.1 monofunctional peptidoglycan glycosyltransferase SgtB [Staphylococcus saprophyticus]MDW3900741.1 monofunctional peptidoglycan glycosyltransferase SgtB [Staphylococcus saprophyticus]MDW3905450.1 monofuncti